MKPLDSPALQSFLDAELRAGASIVDGSLSPSWGAMKRLVILDAPFRTLDWQKHPELAHRDINDPHYWKAEVEDISTGELVAYSFDSRP